MEKHVSNVELEELVSSAVGGIAVKQEVISLIKDVSVTLDVKIGSAELSIAEVFELNVNSLIKLNCTTDSPVDLLLNGKVIARGNLMVVDESFGIQIVELLD